MSATAQEQIAIQVSDDRLRATIPMGRVRPGDLTVEVLAARLKDRGIPLSDNVKERLKTLINQAQSGELSAEPFLIAEGRAAVDGVPARVELIDSEQDAQVDEGGRTDFYHSRILTVKEGDTVGRYTPAVPPQDGLDVFGKPVKGVLPDPGPEIGGHLKLAEDGTTLVATAAGKLHLNRRKVCVLDVVPIDSDVDFSSGNVDVPTDLLINGTVRESFEVKSAKSVTVRGAIEAARVEAGADIEVHGGIAGRGVGQVIAGQQVLTKFCDEANIQAGGDIVVVRECMNSRLVSRGRVSIANGKLVGGYTYARDGAEVRVLGNEAELKTEIAIGIDPQALADAAVVDEQLAKKREAAAKIRETVQPLLAQLKRLTPAQRERATELMYQADEIDLAVQEKEDAKQQALALASPEKSASLVITEIIHPGVQVIFGNKVARIRKQRKGSMRIERRVVKRVEEICLIDQLTGSIATLPSFDYEPPRPAPDPPADPKA